ncbi:hypothetical protein [Phormidesmis priestleyi]
MAYRDRLKYWAIARLSCDQKWCIIARYRNRSDADGHLKFLQQNAPEAQFRVVFEVAD